ncbi:trehalase-like isoform X2 [Sitophilus oryzae]|uniref:Trehalase n=1 Tax=Sitophilus oryzae TaxID=7048 RepID=A0A6J2Y404_SITOR|nr:trehalase-like isoform X2 [Sitophilus oryzae]
MKVSLSLIVTLTMVLHISSERIYSRKRRQAIQSCDSLVFCQGNLLDTIQKARIYADSKTFVDLSQINSEEVTLKNFENFMASTNNKPSKSNITKFIKANFKSESEMEDWTPPDYKPNPPFLKSIYHSAMYFFAKDVVSLWPKLGRRIKKSVKDDPSRYSLIPVPEGFIIPGGRFREIYYWDSYWIIKGLIISDMHDTAKGMLDNFIHLIKTHGMIPNGSRVYYLNRSQPPLFTMMVDLYISSRPDTKWLIANVEHLDTELMFWINERTIPVTKDGVEYKLAHYGPQSNTPRPESYNEDLITCATFPSDDEKASCYIALKAGAESGWDFSSRWLFDRDGKTSSNLTSIDTKRIAPVDLNAFLYKSFSLLSEYYGGLGNTGKEAEWAERAKTWRDTIEAVFYDKDDGIWYDYDTKLNRNRKVFFASNFAPLWAQAYDLKKKSEYGKKAAEYMKAESIDTYLGGIPTSVEQSGEQWDLPNGWPPLQEFVVLGNGLRSTVKRCTN